MRAERKGSLVFILVTICIFFNTFFTLAAEEHLGEMIGGSLMTEDPQAEGYTCSLTRGVFLDSGIGSIGHPGGKTVSVSGDTSCYYNSDKVKVTLYLQEMSNGSWGTIATLGSKTAYNTHYVSNSNIYTVSGGHYYRIKGVHTAVDGDKVEAIISYTNGIWIDK